MSIDPHATPDDELILGWYDLVVPAPVGAEGVAWLLAFDGELVALLGSIPGAPPARSVQSGVLFSKGTPVGPAALDVWRAHLDERLRVCGLTDPTDSAHGVGTDVGWIVRSGHVGVDLLELEVTVKVDYRPDDAHAYSIDVRARTIAAADSARWLGESSMGWVEGAFAGPVASAPRLVPLAAWALRQIAARHPGAFGRRWF